MTGLLNTIIKEIGAKDERENMRRIKELDIIQDSSVRDAFARQLLLDKILRPIEAMQHRIQGTAMHAQWLSGIITTHYRDHKMEEEEAREIASHLRQIAILVTNTSSLSDLKFTYEVITIFSDKISRFKHEKADFRLEFSIREKMLNPLNTCIAEANNFKIRGDLTMDNPILTQINRTHTNERIKN
ncbi:MAG: hypothetical protein WCK82_16040 [Bacteroidota bacterium]